MKETNTSCYDAVKELNRVEGFDPTQMMRHITEPDANGNNTERCYLDVAYRKLWFRLRHPEGAIRKFVRDITDQFAIVEAKIYLDRNDPADSYIANAIVKRYYSPEDKFGDKYLELAETAAVGRALADAGFGIQFADANDTPDPNVVDAPIEMPAGTAVNPITGEVMTASQPKSDTVGAVPAPPTRTGSAPTQPPSMQATVFTQEMSVETILPQMTLEYAAGLVVDCGYYKGKTLGQIAMEKPSSLEWYVNSYKGRNNILRAAAKFLLDAGTAG